MNVPHDSTGEPVSTVAVLSVSPDESDHAALERTFREAEVTLYPNCTLSLVRSSSLESAFAALQESRIPIVLFDGDWLPGAWREMAARIKSLTAPPCLIVISQRADDRLWTEALSFGAFDVIGKPLNQTDVIRIVTAAWRRWSNRYAQSAAAAESHGPAGK